MNTYPDVLELIKRLRMDLTNAQGKLTDIQNTLSALNLPDADETRCPHCDVKVRGPLSLAEHLYVSHDGPLPQHYAAAEQAAGLKP